MPRSKLLKPLFKTNEEAFAFYVKEYEALGGDRFWLEAEQASFLTEDHKRVMKLARYLEILTHLMKEDHG